VNPRFLKTFVYKYVSLDFGIGMLFADKLNKLQLRAAKGGRTWKI